MDTMLTVQVELELKCEKCGYWLNWNADSRTGNLIYVEPHMCEVEEESE